MSGTLLFANSQRFEIEGIEVVEFTAEKDGHPIRCNITYSAMEELWADGAPAASHLTMFDGLKDHIHALARAKHQALGAPHKGVVLIQTSDVVNT
jgi:hypothetical protein